MSEHRLRGRNVQVFSASSLLFLHLWAWFHVVLGRWLAASYGNLEKPPILRQTYDVQQEYQTPIPDHGLLECELELVDVFCFHCCPAIKSYCNIFVITKTNISWTSLPSLSMCNIPGYTNDNLITNKYIYTINIKNYRFLKSAPGNIWKMLYRDTQRIFLRHISYEWKYPPVIPLL